LLLIVYFIPSIKKRKSQRPKSVTSTSSPIENYHPVDQSESSISDPSIQEEKLDVKLLTINTSPQDLGSPNSPKTPKTPKTVKTPRTPRTPKTPKDEQETQVNTKEEIPLPPPQNGQEIQTNEEDNSIEKTKEKSRSKEKVMTLISLFEGIFFFFFFFFF